MVSVCLPCDALLQHLPPYLGFSYLGRGISLHSQCSLPWTRGISSPPPLLTLNVEYLLSSSCSCAATAVSLDVGLLLSATTPDLRCGVAPPGHRPWPWAWGSSSQPLRHDLGPTINQVYSTIEWKER